MRSHTTFQLVSVSVAGILLISLGGCPTRPQGPEPSVAAKVPPALVAEPQRHVGHPFDVSPRDSLLTILAFRGGTLAKVGHNHVIASHQLAGSVFLTNDPLQSRFDIHFPVNELAVDEPAMREGAGPDFPPGVPQSARDGRGDHQTGANRAQPLLGYFRAP